MNYYFILSENKEPIQVTESEYYSHIAWESIIDTWFDNYVVSFDVFELLYNQVGTSFLGVSETNEPKELFTTTVWKNGSLFLASTYNTWREAELGHLEALEKYMGEFLA